MNGRKFPAPVDAHFGDQIQVTVPNIAPYAEDTLEEPDNLFYVGLEKIRAVLPREDGLINIIFEYGNDGPGGSSFTSILSGESDLDLLLAALRWYKSIEPNKQLLSLMCQGGEAEETANSPPSPS